MAQRVVLSDTQMNVATVNWKYGLLKCSTRIACPPAVVWNILTHPENHKIFRNQKACIFREILRCEDGETEVEVEHVAKWSFALGAGTYRLRQVVVENSNTNEISYRLSKPGTMKTWNGTWKIAAADGAAELEADNVWGLPAGTPGATAVRLEHTMQLAVWPVPPLDKLVNNIVSKGIEDMLLDIVREADRIRKGKPQLVYHTVPSRPSLDLTSQLPYTPTLSTPDTPSSTCSYNPWADDVKVDVNSFEIDLSDIEEDEEEEDNALKAARDDTFAVEAKVAPIRPVVPALKLPTKPANDVDLNPDQGPLRAPAQHISAKSHMSKQAVGGNGRHAAVTPRSLFSALFSTRARDKQAADDATLIGTDSFEPSSPKPLPKLSRLPLQPLNGLPNYPPKLTVSTCMVDDTAAQGDADSDARMVKVSSFMDWLPGGEPPVSTPSTDAGSHMLEDAEVSPSSSTSSMFSSSSSGSEEEEDSSDASLGQVLLSGHRPIPAGQNKPPLSRFAKMPSEPAHGGLVQLHLPHRSFPSHSLDQMIDAMWMGVR